MLLLLYLTRRYLCQELSDSLIGRLRQQLDCHMSTILQEAVINRAKATLAKHCLEVVRYDLQFLVREPAVVQLLLAVSIACWSFEIKIRS
jgi:hypothetical protein